MSTKSKTTRISKLFPEEDAAAYEICLYMLCSYIFLQKGFKTTCIYKPIYQISLA